MKLNGYLFFLGNCEEAFEEYKDIFKGTIKETKYYKKEAPFPIPEHMIGKVLHKELEISENFTIYGADSMHEELPNSGKSSISITSSSDELEKVKDIFEKLGKEGNIMMPFKPAPWGEWFGMLNDKHGHMWMFSNK